MSRILMMHESAIRHELRHSRITFRGEELNRITQSVEYIVTQEEWIYKNYIDVDGLTKHIIDVSNRVKYVLGFKSDEVIIGNCPTVDDAGEICGAQLRINPKILESGGNITCRICKTSWDSDKWRFLGTVLETEQTVPEQSATRAPRSRWTI